MTTYSIIFPSHFDNKNKSDVSWEKEVLAAENAGFHISFLYEGMFGDNMKITNLHENSCNLYRGWILKSQKYQQMCELINNNIVTDIDSYVWSCDLFRWYTSFQNSEEITPYSICYSKLDIDNNGLQSVADEMKKVFQTSSVFIKDFLKSRKHEWYDACFIRDASNTDDSIRVINNLINLQGEDFHGGLVCRKFLDLKKIGIHPKSRMPLPLEYRVFFVNKKPIFCTQYWNDGAVYLNENTPPIEWLTNIGNYINSPFVALDIAQDINNKWWVIEVNDGGSAGLPDHVDIQQFYNILFDSLCK